MSPFDYHRPDTVDEAVALLETYGGDGKVLAGGQSLLPVLALRLTHPRHLIDIGRVQGLQSIELDDDGTVSVGATVTHARVERSDVMAAAAPALAGAMPPVGHRAIRSRGTVCGSLAHADPAAELPAVALAVGAEMIVQGPAGQRTTAAGDFFEGYLSSALAEDELLVEVRFPAWAPRAGMVGAGGEQATRGFRVGRAGDDARDRRGRVAAATGVVVFRCSQHAGAHRRGRAVARRQHSRPGALYGGGEGRFGCIGADR